MRAVITTIGIAALGAILWASPAFATPVSVRIEGRSATLFEGTVDTGGHNVRATNEAAGVVRKCDGTNGGASGTPAPTPTAAAYDALSLSGRGFTGTWFLDYNDYLIDGFGGERSDNWGLLVNDTGATVGGCQARLATGDRVIWSAAGVKTPIRLEALSSTAASPIAVRATNPVGGAVGGAAIYSASATGLPGRTLATTGPDGTASVSYGAGFQRLKATAANMIRSNRVVACATACTAAPADVGVQGAPPATSVVGTVTTPLELGSATAGSSGYRRGRIAIRWSIVKRGVGLLRWGIDADDLGTAPRHYVTRARGTTQTSSLVRLPAGHSYALRFTAVDRMLNRSSRSAGHVLVPIDDRSPKIHRRGRWTRAKASNAWKGTLLRGRTGTGVRFTLARGRPTLVLRGGRGRAVLRVSAGRTSHTIGVKAAKRGAHQFVRAFRRSHRGTVTVRVMRGAIDLDGVAASP